MASGTSQYMNRLNKAGYIPKDQYGHAAFLIDVEKTDVGEFRQIITKDVLLSNIGGDLMLRLYQNDVGTLVRLFSMAKRDETVKLIFEVLYYRWVGELALTRTMDGTERKMQATVSSYNPKEKLGSYGENYQYPEQGEEVDPILEMLEKRKRGK